LLVRATINLDYIRDIEESEFKVIIIALLWIRTEFQQKIDRYNHFTKGGHYTIYKKNNNNYLELF
jgi:hypothetical protein